MKLFVIFVFITMSSTAIGQARQLNKLLRQYVFTWNKQLPIALQDSKELLVPSLVGVDELSVIKWKSIDSIRIFDNRKGSIFVNLYGKFIKYSKCKVTDTFCVKYLDTMYSTKTIVDQERIVFVSKTDDEKLSLSIKARKKLKRVFQQLNNTPVVEIYVSRGLPVIYKPKTKEIVLYLDSDERSALTIADLQNAKKLTIVKLDYTFKVFSFDLFIVVGEKTSKMSNQGSEFNGEIVNLLTSLQPGAYLIFDNLKVDTGQGDIRTIMNPPVLFVK